MTQINITVSSLSYDRIGFYPEQYYDTGTLTVVGSRGVPITDVQYHSMGGSLSSLKIDMKSKKDTIWYPGNPRAQNGYFRFIEEVGGTLSLEITDLENGTYPFDLFAMGYYDGLNVDTATPRESPNPRTFTLWARRTTDYTLGNVKYEDYILVGCTIEKLTLKISDDGIVTFDATWKAHGMYIYDENGAIILGPTNVDMATLMGTATLPDTTAGTTSSQYNLFDSGSSVTVTFESTIIGGAVMKDLELNIGNTLTSIRKDGTPYVWDIIARKQELDGKVTLLSTPETIRMEEDTTFTAKNNFEMSIVLSNGTKSLTIDIISIPDPDFSIEVNPADESEEVISFSFKPTSISMTET